MEESKVALLKGDEIGKDRFGQRLYLSSLTKNLSILTTGLSGSGKSYAMTVMCEIRFKKGENILIIAHHGSSQNNPAFCAFCKKHKSQIRRVSKGEVIYLPLAVEIPEELTAETARQLAVQLAGAFSKAWRVAKNHRKYLVEAFEEAISSGRLFKEGVSVLLEILQSMGRESAKNLMVTLEPVLRFVDIRIGAFPMENPIIIYDLNDLPDETQTILARLILRAVVYAGEANVFSEHGCTVLLDEVQYMDCEPDSPLREALGILRKKGISMLLGCPESIADKKSVAHVIAKLVGTNFLFNQGLGANVEVVKQLGVTPTEEPTHASKLANLQIGECLVKGDLVDNQGKQKDLQIVKIPEYDEVSQKGTELCGNNRGIVRAPKVQQSYEGEIVDVVEEFIAEGGENDGTCSN